MLTEKTHETTVEANSRMMLGCWNGTKRLLTRILSDDARMIARMMARMLYKKCAYKKKKQALEGHHPSH